MVDKLFLFDFSHLLFRSYYALPPMKNRRGEGTQALFGFARTLLKILKKYNPTYIVFLCDGPRHTEKRKILFPDYKANRPSIPEDLPKQIEWAKELTKMMGIPILSYEGSEADDLAASIVRWAKKVPIDVVLCSSDKDWYQLIGPHVSGLKEEELVDEESVKKRYGVPPEQLRDALALIGDASDQIPGVAGFGPKKTAQFLEQFGSLEAFFQKVPSPHRFASILEAKEQILRNLQLLALDETVAVPETLTAYKIGTPNEAAIDAFYQEMDFTAFQKERVDKPCEELKLEKTALHLKAGETIGILLDGKGAWIAKESGVWHLDALDTLAGKELSCITHDAKSLIYAFLKKGTRAPTILFDTAIAHYLLDPEGVEKKRPPAIDLLLREAAALETKLGEHDLKNWMQQVELPLSAILAKMQARGIFIDHTLLEKQQRTLIAELKTIEEEIETLAGKRINLNSPKQLAHLLFEELHLPGGRKTASGQYSTDNDTLFALRKEHPIVALLVNYRQSEKLRSTYVDALLQQLGEKSGRIHCSFEQCVTATGRLSCQAPNLQNIPPSVRLAFRPEKSDWAFLSADYSQIELRLLAHLSGDLTMQKAFKEGCDIHLFTASLIFDREEKSVTPEQRAIAKTVNFGVIYGQTAFGLSKFLNVSGKEAKAFIDAYFERYPQVKAFLKKCHDEAHETGRILIPSGRWRFVEGIHSKNLGIRSAAERIAVNAPLQGFSADLIKKAMLAVDQELRHHPDCHLLLQIHDELLFEGPEEAIAQLAPKIKESMETVWPLSIPLIVDIHIGKNWQEC